MAVSLEEPLKSTDTESFVRLLTENQARIYAYIRILAPSEAAAGEILSDTNVALWQNADKFTLGTNFGAWATRVAYFQFLAYRKRQLTDKHIFDDDMLTDLADVAATLSDDYQARRDALKHCLEKLPRRERDLVRQRYQDGSSVKDLAVQLGKNANAISQSLFRVRAALLDCIRRTLDPEIVK